MADKIRLLLSDDNQFLSATMREFLESKPDIELVGVASNGREAIEMVTLKNPDAMITDIIMPGYDGFAMLEEMNGLADFTMPKTIVLSALGSEPLIGRALDLGADYYMVKPFDPDVLYKRIQDMFSMRSFMPKNASAPVRTHSLDEQITSIFLSIGIPAHIKGFQFLREAVKLVVDEPDTINSITKKLYPGIAECFGTSPSKVERAIRHAIEVSWARGKIENINDIFGLNIYAKNEKPTNGEFIALIADHLLLDRSA